MKIRLEHTNNPLNYGTNMMVANFMYYLNKETKINNEYIIDVYDDLDLEMYKKQYSDLNVKRETIDYNFFYSKNIIGKIINKIKREVLFGYFNKINLKKLEKSCDTLIILGGDDLSEYYGIEQLKRELFKIDYIKNKVNIFLVGQTIGPFKDERVQVVRSSLNGVNIYSRDPWTQEYLENNIGLKNIITSSDLALLPLPGQGKGKLSIEVLQKYNVEENEYITIVPSGLYESYCNDREIYIKNIENIINYILENTQYKIVLLPHVLRPQSIDDRNIIKSLEQIYGNNSRLEYIYDVMSPLEARYLLGNGVISISGRMHGAINTLQMRKPAISISYSVKYEGVIGRDLGLRELIVNGDSSDLWINGNVSEETINKIKFILRSYDQIVEKIDKSVKKSEYNILKMIREISKKIV